MDFSHFFQIQQPSEICRLARLEAPERCPPCPSADLHTPGHLEEPLVMLIRPSRIPKICSHSRASFTSCPTIIHQSSLAHSAKTWQVKRLIVTTRPTTRRRAASLEVDLPVGPVELTSQEVEFCFSQSSCTVHSVWCINMYTPWTPTSIPLGIEGAGSVVKSLLSKGNVRLP